MSGFEVYGPTVDPFTVKQALRATLQTWIAAHLAVQADRRGELANALPVPRRWPKGISDFNITLEEQLPAIVIVQAGGSTAPKRKQDGGWTKTWTFDVRAAVGANTEENAESLASAYLAAITGALVQNGTLGGLARKTIPTGDETYTIGTVAGAQERAQRAIYGATFAVTVDNVVNDTAGPAAPPGDPYHPPAAADSFDDADVTVTSVDLEDTL